MVWQAMGVRWRTYGIQFSCLAILLLVVEIHGCCSLTTEGLTLLQFREKVVFDPFGALADWNPDDCNPCMWSGVDCLDGNVHVLDLSGHDLVGVLAPELGDLPHLKFLDLSKNHLSGTIPPEFGQLTALEVLDLRDNYLNGTIPAELGHLHSLRHLLLCRNNFEGSIPVEIEKLSLLTDIQFDKVITSSAAEIGCINRKLGHCIWQSAPKQSKKAEPASVSIKESITHYFNLFTWLKLGGKSSQNHDDDDYRYTNITDSIEPVIRNTVRRILVEQSSNLAALPPSGGAPPAASGQVVLPSRSSGSFPAIPNQKKPPSADPSPSPPPNPTSPNAADSPPSEKQSPAAGKSGPSLKLIIGIFVGILLVAFIVALFFFLRNRAARTIGPWKTGLSGQLQKAFITGVPKLNRGELETACEDFSNIINTHEGVATMYKGTLSSGVEIAVVSTAIDSLKEWSKRSELAFRKKIDTLSRVNHKNFVNLIGYCEEDEPFTRMMVFEYAPNGSLSEHLHVEEVEHLDWNARMRIIMGTAYCLQHMHDLNPPVSHFKLTSQDIYLTDDYAAKIADTAFWEELIVKSKNHAEIESEHSESILVDGVQANVHNFGILLLEIISGKLPYSEEQGHLVNWASQYLNDKRTIGYLIDPSLKSFKDNELAVVCEVIEICIQQDPRKRPLMKEVIQKLRQVIDISPDAATPRLSPLWWAELEILSAEAA